MFRRSAQTRSGKYHSWTTGKILSRDSVQRCTKRPVLLSNNFSQPRTYILVKLCMCWRANEMSHPPFPPQSPSSVPRSPTAGKPLPELISCFSQMDQMPTRPARRTPLLSPRHRPTRARVRWSSLLVIVLLASLISAPFSLFKPRSQFDRRVGETNFK